MGFLGFGKLKKKSNKRKPFDRKASDKINFKKIDTYIKNADLKLTAMDDPEKKRYKFEKIKTELERLSSPCTSSVRKYAQSELSNLEQMQQYVNKVGMKSLDEIHFQKAYAIYCKGEDFYEKGNLEEAEKELLKGVEMKAEVPAIYNRLAIIYRKQKRYDDEIKILRKAITNLNFTFGSKKRLSLQKRLSRVSELALKQRREKRSK